MFVCSEAKESIREKICTEIENYNHVEQEECTYSVNWNVFGSIYLMWKQLQNYIKRCHT